MDSSEASHWQDTVRISTLVRKSVIWQKPNSEEEVLEDQMEGTDITTAPKWWRHVNRQLTEEIHHQSWADETLCVTKEKSYLKGKHLLNECISKWFIFITWLL